MKSTDCCARIPDEKWLKRLDVCTALGRVYGDLGKEYFAKAIAHLQRAIEGYDKRGHAPIAAIEQLANFEARDGEERQKPKLIQRAIERLEKLLRVAAGCAREETARTRRRQQ